MSIFDDRLFGLISGLLSGIFLTVLTYFFEINIIYLKPLGKIPVYIGVIPIVSIIVFTLLDIRLSKRSLNLTYLFITIFTFIYLNSMFQWSVECCPEKYESMYDWKASKGLSWLFDLPLVFGITLIQGFLFDILRELKMK